MKQCAVCLRRSIKDMISMSSMIVKARKQFEQKKTVAVDKASGGLVGRPNLKNISDKDPPAIQAWKVIHGVRPMLVVKSIEDEYPEGQDAPDVIRPLILRAGKNTLKSLVAVEEEREAIQEAVNEFVPAFRSSLQCKGQQGP